jgi:hypothetical protein
MKESANWRLEREREPAKQQKHASDAVMEALLNYCFNGAFISALAHISDSERSLFA